MKQNTKNSFNLLSTFLFTTLLVFTGCSSDDSESGPDTETSSNTLIANAGVDQTVGENNLVTLDGSESSDSNGETFNYSWTLSSQPSGSDANLSNENIASPTFTADISGSYVIELEISNTNFVSTDTVIITATAANTETVELGGRITEDIVLRNLVDTPGVADYCITSDIDLDAVMTIEPGVELHFDADLSFQVSRNGVLIAKGTTEEPIVFTAKNTATPWRGIVFIFSDDFRNEMDYVNISYAGVDTLSISARKAALVLLSSTNLSLTNSNITNSPEIGMFIDENSNGLTAFVNNSFENNAKAPLVLPADQVGQLDTASQFGLSNGEDMIEVTGGNVDLDDPTFWKPMDDGTTYFVTDDLDIDSELNITPGTELHFDVDTQMSIDDGIIIAKGTADNPIIFTAKDTSLPWRGLRIFSDSIRNLIDYAEISYAGIDELPNISQKTALGIGSFTKLALTNSLISNSASNGMLIDEFGELLNFENNRFENNAETPLIITPEQVHQLDANSEFGTTNGDNYIEILGGIVRNTENISWTAFTDNTPYFLSDDLTIRSEAGGLNILPNVKIMVGSDLSIRIDGGFFSAKGESEAGRIVLTAFDTSLPWQGISFLTDDVRNELDFAEVSYAGSDQLGNINVIANVGVGAFEKLSLTNSIISNGTGYGVSLDDTSEVNVDIETTNTITNNTLGPVFFDM